jgi:D-alanyl-D-alanine carboxypeptidase
MRLQPRLLINTPEIELWPAGLLRARSNHDARALARARYVLRRKRDGRYLAAVMPEGVLPLVQRLMREPGIDAALDALDAQQPHGRPGIDSIGVLPLDRLLDRLDSLGLDEGLWRSQWPATGVRAGAARSRRFRPLSPSALVASFLRARMAAHA